MGLGGWELGSEHTTKQPSSSSSSIPTNASLSLLSFARSLLHSSDVAFVAAASSIWVGQTFQLGGQKSPKVLNYVDLPHHDTESWGVIT